jgi:hypothetical protein
MYHHINRSAEQVQKDYDAASIITERREAFMERCKEAIIATTNPPNFRYYVENGENKFDWKIGNSFSMRGISIVYTEFSEGWTKDGVLKVPQVK